MAGNKGIFHFYGNDLYIALPFSAQFDVVFKVRLGETGEEWDIFHLIEYIFG